MLLHRQDIIDALAEATRNGVIIVTCTQCSSGAVRVVLVVVVKIGMKTVVVKVVMRIFQVSGIYETGKALIDIGVIPGR